MTTPHDLSAAEAARLIRADRLSSVELVRSCLDRIAERDGAVGAWEYVDPDLALAQARRRDAEPPRGPLHGVPVGVKDIVDTADQPTGRGSTIYAGRRPDDDAGCVRRLRDAGAVILGKTVTTEFALFHPARTANPRDLGRTPGGSSSGSAAAVADLHVPLALGTQTAGSVVRPAAYCGVFGLKPTYGAFDLSGVAMVSRSLDTLGLFARTADDLAVAAAILGAGSWDQHFGPSPEDPPRITFLRTPHWEHVEPESRELIERAVERIGSDTDVEETAGPDGFEELVDAQRVIMEYEAARSLDEEWRHHRGELSELLRAALERGHAITPQRYERAGQVAAAYRDRLPEVFGGGDVAVVPCVLGEAPTGLDTTGDPVLCRSWTLLGTPAVAVPGLRGPNGLPLGVQVVAAPGRDAVAVAAARWLAPRLRSPR